MLAENGVDGKDAETVCDLVERMSESVGICKLWDPLKLVASLHGPCELTPGEEPPGP